MNDCVIPEEYVVCSDTNNGLNCILHKLPGLCLWIIGVGLLEMADDEQVLRTDCSELFILQ